MAQGLVNRVVADDQLDDAVLQLVEAIKSKPPEALAMGKRLFYDQADLGLAGAYALATDVMACNVMHPEATEGVDAFMEKRPPKW